MIVIWPSRPGFLLVADCHTNGALIILGFVIFVSLLWFSCGLVLVRC
jgi:hypothetical protein